MPTYGYRCTVCSTEFERFQKMSDPPVTECPECGGKVKKLLYPVGIQFKGDGFYVNDYAKSSDKKKAASADSTDSTPAKADTKETGSDSGTTPAAPASPAPAASSSDAS